jgi:small subunit ribosomal protein S35
MKKHFPIEYISSDYCHALPTIKNNLSRIVTIRFNLSELDFDDHAKDKFLRLVGERYNPDTGIITIVTDRCPMKKQNYEYAMYLITACYHESFIVEDWESMKSEADMELYAFGRNSSKVSAEQVLNYNKSEDEKQVVPENFAKSVEQLFNDGENEYNMGKYKEEVIKLLGLSK